MPSIEIVCIGQTEPLEPGNLPFAVQAGTALVSHRRPSHFQSDFDPSKGCINHLGNPRLKNPDLGGMVFAWDLLSAECRDQEEETFVHFAEEHARFIHLLVERLLRASPVRRLIFTSDHEFGPATAVRSPEITLEAFWKLHDSGMLRMNGLYPIGASPGIRFFRIFLVSWCLGG